MIYPKSIHGVECIVTEKPRSIALDVLGKKKGFNGRTIFEVEKKLWDWLHEVPNRKPLRLSRQKNNISLLKDNLRDMAHLPRRPIKVTPGHVHRSRCKRESYYVRRSIGATGKIYFGTYHVREDAEQASVLLCNIINEEIMRRKESKSLSANNHQ